MIKIATGCIGHETNTFSPVKTDLDSFQGKKSRTGLKIGNGIIDIFKGTKTITGGFINAAAKLDFELVPLIWTFATPSGAVAQSAYDYLKQLFIEKLTKAGKVDGVLLDLHGAMVTEDLEDAEGDLIAAVRDIVGDDVPIVSTLDLHANITDLMVEKADVLVGFDEYPHIDCYERGLEAAQIIISILRDGLKPSMVINRLPMLTPPPKQCTFRPPMKNFIDLAHQIESGEGVANVTVSGGFPFADIKDAGVSVVVTTDDNPELAAEKAKEIGDQIWNRRNEFEITLTPVKEAIQYAEEIGEGPVILADGSDNPGGGAPCDGTVILQTFLEENVQDAVVAVIADPESVQKAIEVGVGNEIQLEVGGKTDDKHGKPVLMTGIVHLISDGCFINKGAMGTGMKTDMGRTVVLKSGGVEVIITEKRVQVLDQELLKSVGITPADRKLIALKSSVHFRADFESIAQKIFEVDTPGVHSPNLFQYDYKKLRRPIFPLNDPETEFL